MDGDFIQSIKDKKEREQLSKLQQNRHSDVLSATTGVEQAVLNMAQAIIEANLQHKPQVTVANQNEDLATSEDIRALREAIEQKGSDSLSTTEKGTQSVREALDACLTELKTLCSKDNQSDVVLAIESLETEAKDKDITVTNLEDLGNFFFSLEEAIKGIEVSPKIDVAPTDVKIDIPEVDFSPITEAIQSLQMPETNTEALESLVSTTNQRLATLIEKPTPVPVFKDENIVSAIGNLGSSLINFAYDAYARVVIDATTDRFDYYVGGLAGTKVAEVEIVYTDTTKDDVLSAERTLV